MMNFFVEEEGERGCLWIFMTIAAPFILICMAMVVAWSIIMRPTKGLLFSHSSAQRNNNDDNKQRSSMAHMFHTLFQALFQIHPGSLIHHNEKPTSQQLPEDCQERAVRAIQLAAFVATENSSNKNNDKDDDSAFSTTTDDTDLASNLEDEEESVNGQRQFQVSNDGPQPKEHLCISNQQQQPKRKQRHVQFDTSANIVVQESTVRTQQDLQARWYSKEEVEQFYVDTVRAVAQCFVRNERQVLRQQQRKRQPNSASSQEQIRPTAIQVMELLFDISDEVALDCLDARDTFTDEEEEQSLLPSLYEAAATCCEDGSTKSNAAVDAGSSSMAMMIGLEYHVSEAIVNKSESRQQVLQEVVSDYQNAHGRDEMRHDATVADELSHLCRTLSHGSCIFAQYLALGRLFLIQDDDDDDIDTSHHRNHRSLQG